MIHSSSPRLIDSKGPSRAEKPLRTKVMRYTGTITTGLNRLPVRKQIWIGLPYLTWTTISTHLMPPKKTKKKKKDHRFQKVDPISIRPRHFPTDDLVIISSSKHSRVTTSFFFLFFSGARVQAAKLMRFPGRSLENPGVVSLVTSRTGRRRVVGYS